MIKVYGTPSNVLNASLDIVYALRGEPIYFTQRGKRAFIRWPKTKA